MSSLVLKLHTRTSKANTTERGKQVSRHAGRQKSGEEEGGMKVVSLSPVHQHEAHTAEGLAHVDDL